jgi:signal transduction histidine kinase
VSVVVESERIVIADDGDGFDAAEAATRGLGLLSMRERAKALGGDLVLKTAPGEGTAVTLELDSAIENDGADENDGEADRG